MKSLLFATAVFAVAVVGAEDTAVFSNSGSESSSETPTPAALMKGQPERPSAQKFVHYSYDKTMTKLTKENVVSDMYNPPMKYGGASIVNRMDGMDIAGWDVVYVQTEHNFTMHHTNEAFYAAGYAEGAETQKRIYQNFVNIYPPAGDKYEWNSDIICPKMCQDYISDQRKWVTDEAATQLAKKDLSAADKKYWASVQNSQNQIQGMIDGYHSVIPVKDTTNPMQLSDMQIYLVGFNFELSDVMNYVNKHTKKSTKSTEALAAKNPESHCSALVKVTDDELFMAHDTWSGYNTMLRQYKTYEFGNSSSIPTIAMSSYPGTLHSGDDWYMLSNGFSVQETTNGNMNTTNKPLISHKSVPEMVRVMVSNRISTSGEEWTNTFCQQNSGTYNNQYMVVNHNLFKADRKTAAEKTPKGTLWIVEQMPMYCKTQDVTDVLVKQSYWASYNIPYFPEVYDRMNYTATEKQYGTFFSYTKYARPEIFARQQGNITDLDGMKAMMRFNNYKNDKYSLIPNCAGTTDGKCVPAHSPQLSIANRADLGAPGLTNLTGGPLFAYMGQAAFGAIDSKVIGSKDIMAMKGYLISGPTYQPQYGIDTFNWASSPFVGKKWNTKLGMPDLFDFDYYSAHELVGDKLIHKSVKPAPTDVNDQYKGKFAPYQGFLLGVLLAILGMAAFIFNLKKSTEAEYNPMLN